jgi:cytochrome c oxidase cbb3-type subunit III
MAHRAPAQAPSPPAPVAGPAQTATSQTEPSEHRRGPFVPGQKRPPGDPAQISRGKTLYEINCRGCHGADLRGGDLGGPNLLRSQVALSDLNGELIVPIIQGARQKMGMPKIGLSIPDSQAVAAYVRSVIETIQEQGAPPSERQPPNVVVGDAREGKAYFAAKCSSCHSETGDLKGIATRISDPKRLQTTWVAGGREEGTDSDEGARTVTATVSLPSGDTVSGKLLHIDDFLVVMQLADGTERSFQRDGDSPKVTVKDPTQMHRDLLPGYTDKDIHDVTAYLVTLK